MPKTVTLIGWVFILTGVLAVLELATGLLGSRLILGLNLLLLPAGAGLLAGREKWRIRSIALTAINAVALLIMIVVVYWSGAGEPGSGSHIEVDLHTGMGVALLTIYAIVVIGAFGWVVWYLSRPRVVAAFRVADEDR